MRAELRSLRSPDADLEKYVPDDGNNFSLYVEAMIGSVGSKYAERFGFLVCTAQSLLDTAKRTGIPVFGFSYLIVEEFDLAKIDAAIRALCAGTVADDWDEIGTRLGRYGEWEFSNYAE